ncbi:MAG: glycosyltransferase family 39 protein [Lachnospiraceae bacterium]
MNLKERLAVISKYIIYIVFLLVCLGILLSNLQDNKGALLSGCAFFAAIIGFIWYFQDFFKEQEKKKQVLFLLILCFWVKVLAMLWFQTVPYADYETFRKFASQLASQNAITQDNLYIALFTHVFGYSEFVSWIFKIFGENLSIVVFANILLSTLSMFFIYCISDQIGGERMAVLTSVLWIMFPSQSLWNAFVLSEPLYTTCFLAFWYFCMRLEKRRTIDWVWMVEVFIAGGALVWFQALRPVGTIILIAVVLHAFCVNCPAVGKDTIARILMIICIFVAGGELMTIHIENKIGTEAGGFCWYSVVTGMNEESNGQWSEDTWQPFLENVNRFNDEGAENPAKEAEKVEKEKAIDKIKNLQHPLLLLKNKFINLLQKDSSVVDHMKACSAVLSDETYEKLSNLVNVFYMFLVLSSVASVFFFIKNKTDGNIEFILLYTIGLTFGHILFVEVQPRYHYSILLGFLFAAGYGISHITSKQKNVNGLVSG